MIKITSKAWGQDFELHFPDGPAELPLNRYIDFFAHTRKINYENPFQNMAAAVASFAGVDVSELAGVSAGEGGIKQLYAYALKQLQKWQPEQVDYFEKRIAFEYKGESFYLLNPLLPESDYTVAEAVEAFETVRIYTDAIKKTETVTELAIGVQYAPEDEALRKRLYALIPDKTADLDKTWEIISKYGDPDGNNQYSRYVKLVAIFARKEGEFLPATELKRKEFISERMKYFQGIDTKTALDVDFFLLNMFTRSAQTVACIGSLIRPLIEVVVETNLRNGKHTTGQSKTKKKYSIKRDGGRLSLKR